MLMLMMSWVMISIDKEEMWTINLLLSKDLVGHVRPINVVG